MPFANALEVLPARIGHIPEFQGQPVPGRPIIPSNAPLIAEGLHGLANIIISNSPLERAKKDLAMAQIKNQLAFLQGGGTANYDPNSATPHQQMIADGKGGHRLETPGEVQTRLKRASNKSIYNFDSFPDKPSGGGNGEAPHPVEQYKIRAQPFGPNPFGGPKVDLTPTASPSAGLKLATVEPQQVPDTPPELVWNEEDLPTYG